jgi:hypothetical protein
MFIARPRFNLVLLVFRRRGGRGSEGRLSLTPRRRKTKAELGHPVAYKHAIPPGWAAGQRPPMIFHPSLTHYMPGGFSVAQVTIV